MKTLLALLALVGTAGRLHAQPQVFSSGPQRVALIELYTSEGCSSCPPAEAWLSGLRSDPELWRAFVPVAFHVNYWDHLGWRDALATKAYTDREYAYAEAWGAASVYTPCFVCDGAEWHPRDGRPQKTAAAGALIVVAERNGLVRIRFAPAHQPRTANPLARFDGTVALLGAGVVTQVRAGENAGRTLAHEFVALAAITVPLQRDDTGTYSGAAQLPGRPDVRAARHAVAGWVNAPGAVAPLQATGGWLD